MVLKIYKINKEKEAQLSNSRLFGIFEVLLATNYHGLIVVKRANLVDPLVALVNVGRDISFFTYKFMICYVDISRAL